MGSGRDKRKKNKPTTAGLGAEKTSKKTDKNADKATRRLERKAQVGASLCQPAGRRRPCMHWRRPVPSPPAAHAALYSLSLPLSRPAVRFGRNTQGGEDDIDALLAAFKLEDDRQAAVVVQEGCPSPSPRVYASFIPLPSQASSRP